ncbi:DHA1 family bicyclomycin/chloramphenicol resistance-like MFS transporter [Nocardioides sp. BE266]|uniref:multidrug effflux MFS transporter n=1 Tax=Nocardioides sp. BE266 TaxID=2817725 RepID=UPI0028637D53|nr:multidrug effflux MFS transporter [Nocardioides sp. BE266]MDR7255114.1 DHA1 family bicyclomycin/chloramphenicol resistance-like MFS transporter [Nocardioides sp. BE266]
MTHETQGQVRLPLLLVLASAAAVAPVSTDLYLPGFPAIAAALDASPSGVQLTLTAFLIGLAFGQLVMGPVSDRYGRRGPLLASATVCVVAGVVCALAPSLPVLIAARAVQGFAGAGGMVIGRAVIADIVTGRAAARAFTLMLTVGGIAPVLAPLIGGLLADPVGWRGLLWTVTGLCVAMLVAVLLVLEETHPPERRTTGETSALTAMRSVVGNGRFRGPVAVLACTFGVLMAYVSSSPFVYQNVVGLNEVQYGLAFGVNAVGLISAGYVSSRVIDRWAPATVLRTCIGVQLGATLTFVALAATDAPAWTYPVPIFVAVMSNGGIMGNAAGLAMSEVRPVAGAGSAVLGFTQFALGALVSPLVGLGGDHSALVPAVVMACASGLGFTASRLALHSPVGQVVLDRDGDVVEQLP